MKSRWRDVIDLAQNVVRVAPSEHQAWWFLAQAYHQLQRKSDARQAYTEYYKTAPKLNELRAMREFAAHEAGIPFVEADDSAADTAHPLVMFEVSIDGKRVLVQANNDSGRSLEEVVEAAEGLLRSGNPFNAWVYIQKHPELMSALGDTILSSLAQAQPDVHGRASVEWCRDALRQVRDGAGVAPFAQHAKISEGDFVAFVTAVDDLQPVFQKLAEAANISERNKVVDDHPELLHDARTLTFLRIMGGLQQNPEARELFQSLYTFIRRAQRGLSMREPPQLSAQAQKVYDRSMESIGRGDIAAIDTILAEKYAVDSAAAADASLVALSRGVLLLARYERTGNINDLSSACSVLEEIVKQSVDPDSPLGPYHYATALLRRFEREGNLIDLEQGIAAVEQVLSLVVDGTRTEGAARSLLGSMLMRRAELTGNISDMNNSLAAQRLAITATADEAAQTARLANIAEACLKRFDMAGDLRDLDEATGYFDELQKLAPAQSQSLGARLFRRRYDTTRDTKWLDRAVDAGREAVAAAGTPLEYGLSCNNLSSILRDRYLARSDPADIDEAIELARHAIKALPAGHLQRPLALENLGNNLRVRVANAKSTEDRELAIGAFYEALATAPAGSNVWRSAHANLGGLFEEADDLDQAIRLLEVGFVSSVERAADVDIVELSTGLARAHAGQKNWARAGEVLLAGMDALDRIQRTQLLAKAKRAWLERTGDLHILAAEMLLRSGQVDSALGAIERGRGRLLAEVLNRDRALLADLDQKGDQRIISRYRAVTERIRMLTGAAERGENVQSALVQAKQSLDAIVDEVREATGGAVFQRPLTAGAIVKAAKMADTTLVYLVPLASFGVAFIISDRSPSVRPLVLPALGRDEVHKIVDRYIAAYGKVIESPGSGSWETWKNTLDETLAWCWRACIRDLISEFGACSNPVLIPAGLLGRLPLHAAASGQESALDAVTWRYAPSARSLLQLGPPEPDSLLAVAFAHEDQPLPNTAMEMAVARGAFSNERILDGRAATIAAVRDKSRDATVLHFACHAAAAGYDAADGGLQLADGVLSLQELFDMRLAKGTTVVLSACETGAIGDELPDEVTSIASGMLQSGASAVISSLWAVPDVSTAVLMSRFYYLWRHEARPAAVALRDAQRWMRDSNNGQIAAFLRANVPAEIVHEMAKRLDNDPSGAAFGHAVCWAAFTYAGQGE